MEQEITKLLVFIGIALLMLSPFVVDYIRKEYNAKKELNMARFAINELSEALREIDVSDLDEESKLICREIIGKHCSDLALTIAQNEYYLNYINNHVKKDI